MITPQLATVAAMEWAVWLATEPDEDYLTIGMRLELGELLALIFCLWLPALVYILLGGRPTHCSLSTRSCRPARRPPP